MPVTRAASVLGSSISSAEIDNDSIVNADIKSDAAIALSKLASDPVARANHTGTQLAATISDFSTAAAAVSPETATAVTFTNSWANVATYNEAKYWKHQGMVHLQGVIDTGTLGTACFTLPSGYRPAATVVLATTSGGGAACELEITTAGVCTPEGGSAGSVKLDGLSFRV